MGTTVHPNVRNKFKTRLLTEKVETTVDERIDFCAFTHDKIDADLHQTTIAEGKPVKSFHGTISIPQQNKHFPPIATEDRYKPLSRTFQKHIGYAER